VHLLPSFQLTMPLLRHKCEALGINSSICDKVFASSIKSDACFELLLDHLNGVQILSPEYHNEQTDMVSFVEKATKGE
jgi:hypothetical protein